MLGTVSQFGPVEGALRAGADNEGAFRHRSRRGRITMKLDQFLYEGQPMPLPSCVAASVFDTVEAVKRGASL
jgi:hypothetical protein